jgi:hypothetical protein
MFLYSAGGANTLTFRNSVDGSVIFGSLDASITLDKSGISGPPGFCLPFNQAGWFETAAGSGITISVGTGEAFGGCLVYTKV